MIFGDVYLIEKGAVALRSFLVRQPLLYFKYNTHKTGGVS